jgi:hypothetical protein
MISASKRNQRAGFTIVEILFATTIMTGVLLASFVAMQRDVALQRSSLSVSVAEGKAQSMLFKLERELGDARGANPRATLSSTLGPGGTTAQVTPNTLGFPDQGFLLIDRGNGNREIAAYAGLGGATSFTGLTRGQQCTEGDDHAIGDEVLWAGIAEPIPLQVNPPANLWDGQAIEPTGTIFYQGLGTGFSYRVPTDPAGGTNYLDGDDLQWGETVRGNPTLDGWGAIHFNAVWVFNEAAEGQDLNGDGDRVDLFDVGQIRRRTWDTTNTAITTDVGLGPTVVVQEQCNWGGDLDADGFNDPIFLWDADRRTLHVRLFVIGTSPGASAILRRVESMIFLRNEPGA